MTKIAVIGTGFAGLAAGLNLLDLGFSVTFYDQKGIGQGASGVAAGLLHAFVGANGVKSWEADASLHESLALFERAQRASKKKIYQKRGLKRFPLSERQKEKFLLSASKNPEIKWVEDNTPHLWIEEAYIVNCTEYLNALWEICSQLGGNLKIEKIESLSALDAYDKVLVSAGAGASELTGVELRKIKGQALTLAPSDFPPPKTALNSSAYLFFDPLKNEYHAGATYEKEYVDLLPDQDLAEREIKMKITPFFPRVEELKVREVKAGVRAFTKEKIRPKFEMITERLFVFCGLGSRGLLHHAFCAKEIAKLIQTS